MAPRAHFEQPINPGKLQKEASPTEVLERGEWPRGTVVACLVFALPWLTQQVLLPCWAFLLALSKP